MSGSMSIWDRLKHEFIDIIEFIDDTSNTMVYRFDRYRNEIKNGAKLIVREGQAACFVREGQLADVKTPGTYTLDTKNLPLLGTLLGWKYGFESPFKAEVYFVSTRTFTDLKWGTANPVMLRDPEFGPVRVRAFGTYAMRVTDPGVFLKKVVGTDGRFTTEEITTQLRNLMVSRFSDIVAQSKIPVLDLAGNYDKMSQFMGGKMKSEFGEYGIEVLQLLIENVSLPPEVEAALDKRTSMGVIGNLNAYTQFQTAEAIRDAAKNPGTAGSFIGIGLGQAMAGGMVGGMGAAQQAASVPPPMPGMAPAVAFFVAVNGQPVGPLDAGGLSTQVRGGALTRETLVWRAGMPTWSAAGTLPELAGLFGPPPVPGAGMGGVPPVP
jgi:membrane protease subunit (stomatin/prohibitin family)